jgi:hypothetical protein
MVEYVGPYVPGSVLYWTVTLYIQELHTWVLLARGSGASSTVQYGYHGRIVGEGQTGPRGIGLPSSVFRRCLPPGQDMG